MIDLDLIENFSIDKSDWVKVKFGDIVYEPKESVKDPVVEGVQHVVGLEHIDSEDIHLRRSASIEKSTTFTKKFAEGDVLFGRRRAYLKKAAKADFDGICSGDITVMRASEKILPELLPFIVNNDRFFDYAITHSAGGLSPRVKFKDLAKYELKIPYIEKQEKIASLLLACDWAIESDKTLKAELETFLDVEIESRIHGEKINTYTINQVITNLKKRKPVTSLKLLGDVLKGRGIPKADVIKNGIPCVRYGELYTKHHRLIREFHSSVSKESAESAVKLVKNDILFAGSGETIAEIGKSAAFIGNHDAYAGSDILIFRPKNMDGVYLGYLMNSQLVRQQLNKLGTGATVMHVYGGDINSIKVPDISRQEQENIGTYLESIASRIAEVNERLKHLQTVQKQIVNQVF